MRRLITIVLALGGITGCSTTLESELENQPCVEDNECGGKQACVRTNAEAFADLPGRCLPETESCHDQLGCPCDPTANDCSSRLSDYPEMVCDPDQLVCVAESDQTEPEEETEG